MTGQVYWPVPLCLNFHNSLRDHTPMNFRYATSVIVAAAVVVVSSGCGDSKTEIPKDLNKPLPPPPVGTGGKMNNFPAASEK